MSSDDLKFISIGNDELKDQPDVKPGDTVIHIHENGTEEIVTLQGTKTVEGKPGSLLMYTTADGVSYLAAVDGKLMPRGNLKNK